MKKRIVLFIALIIFSSFSFARGFFEGRFFEVKVEAPVSVNNNAFSFFEFFKKDVVIDLPKIADDMPESGWNLYLLTSPNVTTSIFIGDFVSFGVNTGVDVSGKMSLSKSLFDFLGHGNALNEIIKFSGNLNADIFYHYGFHSKLKIGKISLGITPSVFFPILSASLGKLDMEVENSDGVLGIKGIACADVYSCFSFSGNESFDSNNLLENFQKSVGFDLGMAVGFDFSNVINVVADFSVPIVPGKLKYRSKSTYELEFGMNLLGNGEEDNTNSEELEDDYFDDPEEKETDSSYDTSLNKSSTEVFDDIEYLINRPLKANLTFNFTPFGKGIRLFAMVGCGVYRPFLDAMYVYPEYRVGGEINFIGLVKAQLYTEYVNEVFSHCIQGTVNLRFVQADVGIKFSSIDFLKSFQGAGLGVYVACTVGF